jgi:hypothetical protein
MVRGGSVLVRSLRVITGISLMPLQDSDITRAAPVGLGVHAALMILLLAGMLLLGCGGTGSHHPGRASTVTATTKSKRGAESPKNVAVAVAACRQGVDAASWLPQADKQRLYGVCNYGLRRGLTEIKIYGLQVCTEVTYTSPAKTASEKARVFSACYAPTKEKTAAVG